MGAYSDENRLRTQRIEEETPARTARVERASGAFTLAKGKVAPVEHHAALSYHDVRLPRSEEIRNRRRALSCSKGLRKDEVIRAAGTVAQ